MRLSGVMDADQGVAVMALVVEGQVEGEGAPAIALRDDERAVGQHGGQRLRQLAPEARRQAVGRVEKDEIVLTSVPTRRAEESQRVGATDLGLGAELLE